MDSPLFDLLDRLQGGDAPEKVASAVGTDPGKAQEAMGAALPVLMAALARNAKEPGGAEALHGALNRDHDGAILDRLSDFLDRPDTDEGDGILRHALGNRREQVEEGIGKATGLDAGSASKLLSVLAPIAMGALGRKQREEGLDPGGLARTLESTRREAEAEAPELGMLGSLLDRDGDGSVGDELADLGMKVLGGLMKRKR